MTVHPNAARSTLWVLLTALFLVIGCATTKPQANPLEGWKLCWSQDLGKLDKAIQDAYHDYIQKLPAEERKHAGPLLLFEDGMGQHAISTEFALNGTDWSHVLIYDNENKRVKVIKYVSGHYRSENPSQRVKLTVIADNGRVN
jgi:hypothetical protein